MRVPIGWLTSMLSTLQQKWCGPEWPDVWQPYVAGVRLMCSRIPAAAALEGGPLRRREDKNPSSVLAMKSCNLTRNKELMKLIVMSVMSVWKGKLDMDYRIFILCTYVNACNCIRWLKWGLIWGCTYTERVCTESWLWEDNPLPHWGIEPASAVW